MSSPAGHSLAGEGSRLAGEGSRRAEVVVLRRSIVG
jgi:hypothetical protein